MVKKNNCGVYQAIKIEIIGIDIDYLWIWIAAQDIQYLIENKQYELLRSINHSTIHKSEFFETESRAKQECDTNNLSEKLQNLESRVEKLEKKESSHD